MRDHHLFRRWRCSAAPALHRLWPSKAAVVRLTETTAEEGEGILRANHAICARRGEYAGGVFAGSVLAAERAGATFPCQSARTKEMGGTPQTGLLAGGFSGFLPPGQGLTGRLISPWGTIGVLPARASRTLAAPLYLLCAER